MVHDNFKVYGGGSETDNHLNHQHQQRGRRPKSAFGNLATFKRLMGESLPQRTRKELSKEWQIQPTAEEVLNELMKDPFAEDEKSSQLLHD